MLEEEKEEEEVHTKDTSDTFTCCLIHPIRAAILTITETFPRHHLWSYAEKTFV